MQPENRGTAGTIAVSLFGPGWFHDGATIFEKKAEGHWTGLHRPRDAVTSLSLGGVTAAVIPKRFRDLTCLEMNPLRRVGMTFCRKHLL